MSIKLPPRLKRIAECASGFQTLADIGTDHGYIPVKMIQEGRVKGAIACDINRMPLQKAEDLIQANHLSDKIKTRLGSGLSVLEENEADLVVIAGMGGVLISDILEASEKVAKSVNTLILQPMNAQNVLRHYLEDNGYNIVGEALAKEGKRVYEILIVQVGKMKVRNELEYELGIDYQKRLDPLLIDLIDRKLELEMRIIAATEDKITPVAKEQYKKSKDYIEKLNEVKRWLSDLNKL
ncbi:class I SAM-dependent methyltransferase [Eubacteriaceae bacterium ES3]|nr:class I SAM-dependent methyltransferase [Eubacteriaceae bacterium ES3]